ncbi:peptidoglycan hydrolase-like protein with peptidoglycan-binding domain [Arcanobacterium pluranimalium]|uniref:peptidoglycan-binding protein n=1 Tax=Arcanobacterium pluranimalium TaxID=108028 RepID=UPI001957AE29|nr:peptidoglycan-binding protein [Arcanobacterium pluranimalium]MBM7824334.1 peptidoglycan hydrolase-like protein with peptidoglycan-binding domain [Arcanobacterium pluranimalium]
MSHEEVTTSTSENKKKKFMWIFLTVFISLLVVAGAFFAGTFVHSKNEEAIENSQYKPEITAKVEKRNFPAVMVEAKGKASLGASRAVVVTASEGNQAVVTRVTRNAGETLNSGQTLAFVSGRPVIALDLPFDLYRDINEGNDGADVKEIQRALARLGLYKGKITGVYDARTANAMKALYKRVGSTPPSTGVSPAGAAPSSGATATPAPASAPASSRGEGSVSTETAPAPAPTLPAAPPLPPIRAAEFISLTAGPATIVSIAGVNQHITPEAPLATLRSGQAVAVARVSVADIASFGVGASVDIAQSGSTSTGQKVSVIGVSEFRQASEGEHSQVPGYDITVAIPGEQFQDGQEVVLTAASTANATEGNAIPITALREEAGKTYVILKRGSESKKVEIKVARISEGFALLEGDTLKTDDVVVVAK